MNLDKTDLKILKKLQENGKITNLQLSKEIGLSPAPTLERVKKLEGSGVIKSYHALVDEEALEIGLVAYMQVTLVRQVNQAIQRFIDHVENVEEVVEVYQVTGQADFLVKIMAKDIPSFDKMVRTKFDNDVIGQMQTMIVLSTEKISKVIPHSYTPDE